MFGLSTLISYCNILFIYFYFFLGLTVTGIFFISMEFCWFAICTILAFIPWISAEEKLLYQTPNEIRWGGWEATTNGLSSMKLVLLFFYSVTRL